MFKSYVNFAFELISTIFQSTLLIFDIQIKYMSTGIRTHDPWIIDIEVNCRVIKIIHSTGLLHCNTDRTNGEYSNSATSFVCTGCPSNKKCTDIANSDCPDGFWSAEGDMFCSKCARGQHCPGWYRYVFI